MTARAAIVFACGQSSGLTRAALPDDKYIRNEDFRHAASPCVFSHQASQVACHKGISCIFSDLVQVSVRHARRKRSVLAGPGSNLTFPENGRADDPLNG